MGPTWRRAIVVGASSGIGEAIARQLARDGTVLAMVARRADRLGMIADSISEAGRTPRPAVYPCDVRDTSRSAQLFAEIVCDLGGLDLIVYSSGVMPKGAHTGFPTNEDVAAIETNFTGAVVWLNAAARYFEEQRHGTITGIGSVAGDRGRTGNPVYNATKAALATYLEALRNRLARKGVTVVTIKPGLIRTDMIGSRPAFPPLYGVDDTARLILAATRAGKRVAYVPPWWRWIALGLKAVPAAIMERLPV